MPPCVHERARAGQKNERWGAEVRDPPREEDPEGLSARWQTRVHTRVIDGHQHHHRAANDVDGRDACWLGDRPMSAAHAYGRAHWGGSYRRGILLDYSFMEANP
jgi:hypothetical protein